MHVNNYTYKTELKDNHKPNYTEQNEREREREVHMTACACASTQENACIGNASVTTSRSMNYY